MMDVTVTAFAGSTGPIDWKIDGKKAKDSSIFFAKGSGPQTVKFKLDDTTGRDLRFDSSSPFWVSKKNLSRPCSSVKASIIQASRSAIFSFPTTVSFV